MPNNILFPLRRRREPLKFLYFWEGVDQDTQQAVLNNIWRSALCWNLISTLSIQQHITALKCITQKEWDVIPPGRSWCKGIPCFPASWLGAWKAHKFKRRYATSISQAVGHVQKPVWIFLFSILPALLVTHFGSGPLLKTAGQAGPETFVESSPQHPLLTTWSDS